MAILDIGGRRVEVSDDFLTKPQEERDTIVGGILQDIRTQEFVGQSGELRPRQRGLGERFRDSFRAGQGSTAVAEGIRRATANVPTIETQGMSEDQRRQYSVDQARLRREQEQGVAADDPAFRKGGSVVGGLVRGATDFAGGMAGAISTDPTALIAPGRRLVTQALGAAGIGGAENIAAQGLRTEAGIQDEIDPTEVVISTAAGPVLIGSVAGARVIFDRVTGKWRRPTQDEMLENPSLAPETTAEQAEAAIPVRPAWMDEASVPEGMEFTGRFTNSGKPIVRPRNVRAGEEAPSIVVHPDEPTQVNASLIGEETPLDNFEWTGKYTQDDRPIVRSDQGEFAFTGRTEEGEPLFRPIQEEGVVTQQTSTDVDSPYYRESSSEMQEVAKNIFGRSAKDAAQWLSNNAKNAPSKAVMERVQSRIAQLEDMGFRFRVENKLDQMDRSIQAETSYNPRTQETTIYLGENTSSGVVAHEFVHAVTLAATEAAKRAPRNSPLRKAVEDLNAVRNAATEQLEAKRASGETLTPFEQDLVAGRLNALDDIDEMMSWALTEPNAQEFLKGVNFYKGRSLWTAFTNALARLLGLKGPKDRQALEQVIQSFDTLTSPRVDADIIAGRAKTPENLRLRPQELPAEVAEEVGQHTGWQGSRRNQGVEEEGGMAGNINLDNIQGRSGIDALLKERAKHAPKNVQTWEQTQQLAEELGLSPKDIVRGLAGNSAEEIWAIREMTTAAANRVAGLAQKIHQGRGTDADRITLTHNIAVFNALDMQLRNKTREIGRALNIMKKTSTGRSGAANIRSLRELDSRMFADPDNVDALVSRFVELQDNPRAKGQLLRDSIQPRAEDYILSFRYNAMLSGLGTHFKNTVGTSSNLLLDGLNQTGAAIGGQLLRGTNADRVYGREVIARMAGMWEGAKRAMDTMGTAWKHGVPLDQVNRLEGDYTGIMPPMFRWLEIPSRAMALEDEFFRQVAMMGNLYAEGARSGIRSGKSDWLKEAAKFADDVITDGGVDGRTNLGKAFRDSAEYAKRMRFQDDPSSLGKWIMDGQKTRVTDGGGARTFRTLLKVALPFVRTPDSLIRTAIRNSPLGFMDSVNIKDWKAGGARRQQAIARVAIGSMISWYIAAEAFNERVTGLGPSDWRQKQTLMATGWRPNSVRIGDTYYSYEGLDPISTVLSTVASAVEGYRNGELTGEGYGEATEKAIVGFADALVSTHWMEGLNDILGAVFEPGTSGVEKGKQAVAGTVSSFVPAILRNINNGFIDPPQRDTRGEGTFVDVVGGRIEGSVPGLGQEAPIKHDVYGRPQSNERDFWTGIGVSQIDDDPVVQEVNRIARALGETNPVTAVNRAAVGGISKDRKLTSEELQAYQNLSGQFILETLREYMSHPEWRNIPDNEKYDFVKKVVRDMRANARDMLFPESDLPEGFSLNNG